MRDLKQLCYLSHGLHRQLLEGLRDNMVARLQRGADEQWTELLIEVRRAAGRASGASGAWRDSASAAAGCLWRARVRAQRGPRRARRRPRAPLRARARPRSWTPAAPRPRGSCRCS